MAFPTLITGLAGHSIFYTQPFVSSAGNVYVFGRDTSAFNLVRAFKATDPTVSFSNVGTDWGTVAGASINTITAVQLGDVIHVAVHTTDGADTTVRYVHYGAFNMATDVWSTGLGELVVNITDSSSGSGGATIGVRSNGDVIILYPGNSVAVMGSQRSRVKYARRIAANWTINVAVDNAGAENWIPAGVVLGGSNRMHFFFYSSNVLGFYQRALTSADVLEAFPSAFTTDINTLDSSTMHLGGSYDSSGTVKVLYPFRDGTASPIEINSANLDSADAPTVTISTNITGTVVAQMFSAYSLTLVADGTTLWHLFVGSSDGDIYSQSNANGAGWSTPVEFFNHVSNVDRIRGNIYTRGSSVVLGMTFYGSGDVNPSYHEQVLRTLGVTGNATLNLAAFTTVADGTVSVGGDGTLSVGPITTTTDSSVSLSGDSSLSLGDVTTTTDADLLVQGEASHTLDATTTTAAGTVADTPVTGDANFTLDNATTTADGVVAIAGDASLSLAAVTTTADGSVSLTGDASLTLDATTVSATGGTLAVIEGNASITIEDTTTTSAAVVDIIANASIQLSDLAITADASIAISGDSSITINDITTTSDASILVAGDASIPLSNNSTTGEGVVISGIVGNATITLDNTTTQATGSVTESEDLSQRGGDDAPPRRVKKVPASDKPNPEKLFDKRLEETLEDLVNPKPAVEVVLDSQSNPSPEAVTSLANALLPRYTLPKQRVYRPERKRLPPPLSDDELILLLLMVI